MARQPPSPQRPSVADAIRARKEEILARWEKAVRTLPIAAHLDRTSLIDHLPALLDRICALAEQPQSSPDRPGARKAAEGHAVHRLEAGFDLNEVVAEYTILRETIADLFEGDRENEAVVHKAIDHAIVVAVEAYVRSRDRDIELASDVVEHGDATFVLDPDYRMVMVNRNQEKLSQLPREKTLGRVFWDIWPDTIGPESKYWVEYHRAMEERVPVRFDEHYKPLDLWTDVTAYPIRSGGIVVFFRDATQRKRAEAEARKLQTLIEVHPDFLYLFDRRHRFVYVSPSLLRLWGRPLEDTLGRNFEEMGYPPELVSLHEAQLTRAFEGERVRGDNTYTSPDGRPGHYEHIFVPVRGSIGEVDFVAGVTRDITERKHRELLTQLLADISIRLAESLDIEQTLAQITTMLVPVLGDWCGLVLLRDDDVVDRIAVRAADPAKQPLADVLKRQYELQIGAEQGIGRVLRTGEPHLVSDVTDDLLAAAARNPADLQRLREIGMRSYLAVPLSARGRVLGAMSLATAESGRRYTTDDLTVAREVAYRCAVAIDNARLHSRLQDAVRLRENLLAIVSHDLKNPLSAISLNIASLSRSETLRADQRGRQRLSAIERSIDRMERLIADLLDMASIHAGHFSVERTLQPVRPILEEAIDFHAPLAREKGVELTCALDIGTEEVCVDGERVLQALGNLLGNAVKFCGRGDTVTLAAGRTGPDILVSVADSGPGIPEDERAKIFEPYWTERRQAQKGTGLGLFITKGIVEAHGGALEVESEPGRGATFRFTLPRAGCET